MLAAIDGFVEEVEESLFAVFNGIAIAQSYLRHGDEPSFNGF